MTFLEYYCDYFYLQLLNPIEVFCDRKSYVTKCNEIQSNTYSKLKEHKGHLALLKNNLQELYSVSCQRSPRWLQTWYELTIPEHLDKSADIIATNKAKPSLNIPLPSAPFAIYIHQQYIHLSFQQRIRDSYYENEVRSFLQSKHT